MKNPDELPRDNDGYVDLDAMANNDLPQEVSLHWEEVPSLPPETWDAIVSAAPHVDPAIAGIDVDRLVVDPSNGPLWPPGANDNAFDTGGSTPSAVEAWDLGNENEETMTDDGAERAPDDDAGNPEQADIIDENGW